MGVVIAGDEAPDVVARVEQVPAEVVEHGVRLREEQVELLLEGRYKEHPRNDVVVGPHDQPLDATEKPLVVVAEEVLVLKGGVVVEVHVRKRRQLLCRRDITGVGPDDFVLQHVSVPLGGVDVVVGVIRQRKVRRQQPRGTEERLAEELVHGVAPVYEEDAIGEQGVQERCRGGDGEEPVPDAAVRYGDYVRALRRRDALVGPELLQGVAVGGSARAAPSLQGLLPPELGDEVLRRLPAWVATVHG